MKGNMPTGTATERILRLAAHQPLVRPRDVEALGIAREFLLRLYRQGLLVRPARGVYTLPDISITEHHSLAVTAKRVPRGVVCLLSALRFHELTTQDPHDVWIAIDFKAYKPSIESPSLRVVRFSGRALTEGIDTHEIEGAQVRIYRPAKTVADCFKYRNKIGIDVAIEALRDALRTRKATIDEISRFAKVCRVANVMRPYLESAV
jgi:predicted transcriptional regulator of viral defense system